MKISGVYKITNRINGKIYVGSATDIKGRWKLHQKRNDQVICHAIKKYGVGNFNWEILEETDNLIEREQHYLDTLQPFVHNGTGYNVCTRAFSPLGLKRTEETKQKMRDSWHTARGPEYYKKLSDRSSNQVWTEERRAKLSKSMTGKTWNGDKERVETHRLNHLGKPQTAHWRTRMAEVHTGAKRSEESKAKMSAWQQVTYEVTGPNEIHIMTSKEMKEFCKENSFTYSNLQRTSKHGGTYKGWTCKLISF